MIIKKLLLTALCSAGTFLAAAQNTAGQYQQLAENAVGVAVPKVDSNGILQSFLVIGKGSINKALPKQQAVIQADKAAKRSANNALSQYLNTSVKWQETSTGELVCKTIGSSDNSGAAQSSSEVQATDVTSERSRAASQAVLSGLQIVWAGQDSNGLRVHIYGWKAKNSAAIAGAGSQMANTAAATVTQAKKVEAVRQQDPAVVHAQAEASAAAADVAGVHAATAAPAAQAQIDENGQWVVCVGIGKTRSLAVHAALVEGVQQVYGTHIQSSSAMQERFKSFTSNQVESASVEVNAEENILAASKGFVKSYRIVSVTTVEETMQRAEIKALLIPPRSNEFKTIMVCPMQLDLSKLTEVIQIGNRRLSGSELANMAPDYFERAFANNGKFVVLNYKDMPKVVSVNRAAARNIAAGIVNPVEAAKFGQMLSADWLLISRVEDIQYKANRTFDPKTGKIGEKWSLRASVVFKLVDTKYGNTLLNKPLTVEMNEQSAPGASISKDADLLKVLMELLSAELSKTIAQIK